MRCWNRSGSSLLDISGEEVGSSERGQKGKSKIERKTRFSIAAETPNDDDDGNCSSTRRDSR